MLSRVWHVDSLVLVDTYNCLFYLWLFLLCTFQKFPIGLSFPRSHWWLPYKSPWVVTFDSLLQSLGVPSSYLLLGDLHLILYRGSSQHPWPRQPRKCTGQPISPRVDFLAGNGPHSLSWAPTCRGHIWVALWKKPSNLVGEEMELPAQLSPKWTHSQNSPSSNFSTLLCYLSGWGVREMVFKNLCWKSTTIPHLEISYLLNISVWMKIQFRYLVSYINTTVL